MWARAHAYTPFQFSFTPISLLKYVSVTLWWSLFSDSFNFGFICSRIVNLVLNRNSQLPWNEWSGPFFYHLTCPVYMWVRAWERHHCLPIETFKRSIYFKILYVIFQVLWCWLFALFLFVSISVLDIFWPPVDRTIENWITCRHNLSLHRFISAAQLSFAPWYAVKVCRWHLLMMEHLKNRFAVIFLIYNTKSCYYTIRFAQRMDKQQKQCTL